jgi:hypothetical protein
MDKEWVASDELNNAPLLTAEEERLRAKVWMDTAAFHCRNEEYYRKRVREYEGKENNFSFNGIYKKCISVLNGLRN